MQFNHEAKGLFYWLFYARKSLHRLDLGSNNAKRVQLITASPPHGIGEPGDVVPASLMASSSEVQFYTNFATETGYEDPTCTYVPLELMHLRDMRRRKYLELKKATGDSGPMSCAMVGSVLHATNSLCLADKWGDWIMDQSRRGHDSIVADMHSKLSAEGEQCHDVYCTEHGGSDVRYSLGPVDAIVGKTLRFQKSIQSDELLNSIFS
ncbi:hypothetical protein C8J57DRAFT_1251366 [Mycena rebaudengoi]|nr:hypothetical protein C8J57DRAFT_1251366 [Mycena rebaudengoi]